MKRINAKHANINAGLDPVSIPRHMLNRASAARALLLVTNDDAEERLRHVVDQPARDSFPDRDGPFFARWNDEKFAQQFKYSKAELRRMTEAFRWPSTMCLKSGVRIGRCEGLAMMLAKMVYPTRLVTMEVLFQRSKAVISEAATILAYRLWNSFSKRILDRFFRELSPETLEMFVTAIRSRGAPVDNLIGFIDLKPLGCDEEDISLPALALLSHFVCS